MVIHAFFKSTLFLRRGSLISQVSGGQDSRFYGGFEFSSASYVYFLVSCYSLAGFPFFIGFYSKDSIISYLSGVSGGACFLLFLVGCVFTVGYRFRLVKVGFFGYFKSFVQVSSVEVFAFVFPVFLLFVVCFMGGGVLGWFFLSDSFVFFRGFDLLWGVFLIFLGVLFYIVNRVSFYYLNFFSTISFLRWIRTGGFSRFFKDMLFYRGETG